MVIYKGLFLMMIRRSNPRPFQSLFIHLLFAAGSRTHTLSKRLPAHIALRLAVLYARFLTVYTLTTTPGVSTVTSSLPPSQDVEERLAH